MRKLTQKQTELLEVIAEKTQISTKLNGQLYIMPWYRASTKNELKAIQPLIDRGLVERYTLTYYCLTPKGWELLNSCPQQVFLANLRQSLQMEITSANNSKLTDKPNDNKYTLDYYRELYRNPELSRWDVYKMERERCLNNRVLYESDIQAIEHQLAKFELKFA